MIFKFEAAILKWIKANIIYICFICVIFLSLIIRFSLKDFVSGDASGSLIPWYNAMNNVCHTNGAFSGLGTDIPDCNYSFLYQFFIAIMTYLPINPLYGYKILSILFDYFLAFIVSMLVYDLSSKNKLLLSLLGFTFVICSPIVILNSSAWAQCDSIYTFWVILSIYCIYKERYLPAFIFLGIAFSFKLQAIFALPFFMFYYIYKRKISIIYFITIPLCMIITSIPAFLYGRQIVDVFTININNTSLFQSLSLGYPTFWRIIADGSGSDGYTTFKVTAIILTIIILGLIITYWIYNDIILSGENIIFTAFILTYSTVLFLPAMHERYGYLYEIMAIIIALLNPKTIPCLVILVAITLNSYGIYLFGNFEAAWLFSTLNFICYISYMIILNREIQKGSE